MYKGRWGSTVEAPAQQEWFAKAENPVSRSFLKQVNQQQHFSHKSVVPATFLPAPCRLICQLPRRIGAVTKHETSTTPFPLAFIAK